MVWGYYKARQSKLFTSNSLKFNFNYFSGIELPKQFLIETDAFNLTSAVLLDVSNYPKSVRDISLKIKDLL